MEFFSKAKAVRLRSHLDKYLEADEDEETVRQSRDGSSHKARWMVEFVEGKNHVILLKSCHGRYLAASDEPFLLGMTGKKVHQTIPATEPVTSVEWEPIKEGSLVKLRTKVSGKYLRANWGTPPWRNSVTHDLPRRTATQDWVLWEVDVVDISLSSESESPSSYISPASSFSSMSFEETMASNRSGHASFSSLPDDSSASNTCSSSAVPNRSIRSGMELLNKAKAVRLQSHSGKYLVAGEDEETVRQSRNGSSHKARWTVEFVGGKSHVIRLKSCHGRYLTAADKPFLLGMTGKKVLQTATPKNDTSIEWEPVREWFHIKLRTHEGKFLRANGGTPPWRNSITHDVPHRTATQDWVLWGVDVVDISILDSDSVLSSNMSSASSFSSSVDDFTGSPDTGTPMVDSSRSPHGASGRQSAMELFQKAKTVRLRSHHDKFLVAEDNQESVCQDRRGLIKQAKWTVEIVDEFDSFIRLKSCYGKYLTATDEQYRLGLTGHKVTQSMPRKLDSKIEWEPIRDGFQVRFKTRYGNYLRANGGLPPWRNSITHDIPHRHTDWVLWDVDVVELRPDPPPPQPKPTCDSLSSAEPSSPAFFLRSHHSFKFESNHSMGRKSEGRIIHYRIVDDDGKIDESEEERSFNFKGHGLDQLTDKLEEETGLENIIVCSRNAFNGKLYPLRLTLPPNNATMHIVVVPSSSVVARDFAPEDPPSST